MQNEVIDALQKNDWPLEKHGELTLILSPLLKSLDFLRHAFTTRLGGQSESPLDSFNLGRHWPSEESRQDALQNRRKLCRVFSLDFERLAVPGQDHSTNILVLEGQKSTGPFYFPGIDAIATEAHGQPVLLHFADCVPVILVDRVKKKVCVIHAGWRGTAGGIVRKSVKLMVEQLGSSPGDLVGAIGPAIGSCCYETGSEVVDGLKQVVSAPSLLTLHRNGRPFPDLKAFNAMQLLDAGVRDIDVTSWCTACHPELFYSHRQSGGRTGRQGVLACLI